MRSKNTVHFDVLARDLAMRIGATVRRWWLEPKNAQRFHVEAVRTFVGAKPVVVEFTATLDTARPPQLQGQPQMQVITEPPPLAAAVPTPNGRASVVSPRPRPAPRSRVARPRVRTGAGSAAKTRPRPVTTRASRTATPRPRPRAHR